MRIPQSLGEFKFWLLLQSPMWDYVCPRCNAVVDEREKICHNCGENIKVPIRVPPMMRKDKKALSDYVHKNIMPWLTPQEYHYLAQYFTIIFSDGFESGNLNAWTGYTTGVTVTSGAAHHGTYKAEIAIPAFELTYIYKFTDTAYMEWYARYYFKMIALPTIDQYRMLIAFGDIDQWLMAAGGIRRINGANKWFICKYKNGVETYVTSASGVDIAANTWICLELHFIVSDTAGAIHLYVNGNIIADLTDTGFDSRGTTNHRNLQTLWIGDVYAQNEEDYTIHADCVVAADIPVGPEVDFAGGAGYLQMAKMILGM